MHTSPSIAVSGRDLTTSTRSAYGGSASFPRRGQIRGSGRASGGKSHGHCRSLAQTTVYADLAVVLPQDAMRREEAEPCSCACPTPIQGGVEYSLYLFRRHSYSRVDHLDLYFASFNARSNLNRAAARDRFRGIAQHVHEHVDQAAGIAA